MPARALAAALAKIPLGQLQRPLAAVAQALWSVGGRLLELLQLAASNPKHAMAFVRNNLKTVIQGVAKLVPVLGVHMRKLCPAAFTGHEARAEGVLGMSGGGGGGGGGATDCSAFYSNEDTTMNQRQTSASSSAGSGGGGGGGTRDWPGSSLNSSSNDGGGEGEGGISDWISTLGAKGKGD